MKRTFQATVLVIILLAFVYHLTGYSANYDLMNIRRSEINAISLDDRGILGNHSIQITKHSEVNHLFELFKASKRIEYSDVNLRNSNGLCDIELKLKNNKSFNMTITNAVEDGGIINSGNFYYRNDSLLVLIKDFLKGK